MSLFFRTLTLMALLLSRGPAFAVEQELPEEEKLTKAAPNQICPKLFKHSLSGLYGIEPIHYQAVQPYTEFEQLYKKAETAQQELAAICTQASLLSGTTPEIPAVKSKLRAEQKIKLELEGRAERITDLARATIVADDIEGLVTAYEVLSRETNIVKVKNRFKSPAASGYRDLNLLVELPDSNIIAEIQLHLRSIAQVKSGEEHNLYEMIQEIERKALYEERTLSEIEQHQITNLRKQSQQLYQQAWQPYITTQIKAA